MSRYSIPLTGRLTDTRLLADKQCAVNMYPHSKMGYRQFPGLVEFANNTTSTFRGSSVMAGMLYVVWGTTLNSISSNGTITAIAGSVTGTEMLVMDNDGTQLVMTGGADKFLYTVGGGLVAINDASLGDAFTNAYLDNTFYYENSLGRIYASDLADASSISGLAFITSESHTDGITRLYALNQLLYSFGTTTTEIYYTSGTGNTRLSRQAVWEHGIIGRYAVDSIDDTIYILDESRRLTKMMGTQRAPIFVPGLGEEIDSYVTVTDCIVSCYTINQENFIDLIFPTENISWTIHEPSSDMIKREDWNGGRTRNAGHAKAYNRVLGLDHSSGQIFRYDAGVYRDNGNAIARKTNSELVTSELVGQPSRPYVLNAILFDYDASSGFLTTDAGVVLTTDADEPLGDTNADLTVDVSISKDGRGNFFTTPRTLNLTATGTARLGNWGRCQDTIIRIETSSDTSVSFLGLATELELLDN